MKRLSILLMTLVTILALAGVGWAANKVFLHTTDHNWNTPGNWTPSGVPGASDNVSVGSTETSMVINVDTGNILTFDVSGTASGITISGSGDITITSTGNFTLGSNVSWTHSGTLKLVGTTNVTTAGKSLGSLSSLLIFYLGNVTLLDDLDVGTRSISIYNDVSLTTNGHTISCGGINDGSAASSQTINLGNSTVNAHYFIYFGASTPTITSTGATINCDYNGSGTYNFGGATWSNATINVKTYNTNTSTLAGLTNFTGTLNLTRNSGTATATFPAGVTSKFGAFAATNMVLNSSDNSTAAILSDSAGTNTLTGCTLTHLTAQGGATWNAWTDTNTVDQPGTCSGWALTGAVAPTASIFPATNITQTTLTGVGSSTDGGGTIPERGILLKAGSTPTISSYDFKLTSSGTSGAFAGTGMNVTGLTANTAYTAVAFATQTESGTTEYSSTTTYTTLRNAGTFYLRADGTATTLIDATGHAAYENDVTKCLNFTTAHWANYPTNTVPQVFVGDDQILISDEGGTYTTTLAAPSSGTDGHSIVYQAVSGEHPVIDLSVSLSGASWTNLGGGIYKTTATDDWLHILWDGNDVVKAATTTDLTDGDWFYNLGVNHDIYYRPSIGTPADHTLKYVWLSQNWVPYGIDIRDRSNIELNGTNITINYCGIGHAMNMADANSPGTLKNIKIHGFAINKAFWGIWGNLLKDCISQDVEIYNNVLNYCNSGISTWSGSETSVGHAQHPLRHNIHNNQILNLYQITPTRNWTYAMIDPSQSSYSDHEGISFQDQVDCNVDDNTISTGSGYNYSSDLYWNRAIVWFLTQNGVTKTSGNATLRNRITGEYHEAIYIAGIPTAGLENNTFAGNVIQCTSTTANYSGFWMNLSGSNPATGMNYWSNNTINFTLGAEVFRITGLDNDGNWTIQNNIFNGNTAPAIAHTPTETLQFDHNQYYVYSTGGSTPFNGMSWNTWLAQGVNYDGGTGTTVSHFGTDASLRVADSALTASSPAWCINGGTPIEGITVISGVGQPGIDGKLFNVTNPAMGAYAQPVSSAVGGGLSPGLGLGLGNQPPPWLGQ